MLVVGITGGIATGKTTVGKLFQEWGAKLVEADAIGWELLRQEEIKKKLIQVFGTEILNSKDQIDRKKLGGIVFSSREAREELDSIVHPRLLEQLKERIEELRRSDFKGVLAVVAALIPEWGIQNWFDKLVVVVCPQKQAVERLATQGLSEQEARGRVTAQLRTQEKVRGAHFIIENSGDMEGLRIEAKRAWDELTQSRKPSSS